MERVARMVGRSYVTVSVVIGACMLLFTGCTREVTIQPSDVEFSWTGIESPRFNGIVLDMAVDDGDRVLLACYSKEYDDHPYMIMISEDGGETWLEKGLSDDRIIDLHAGDNGYYFATTYEWAVHRSTDNGVTWERQKDGFPEDRDHVYCSPGPGGELLLWADSGPVFLSSGAGDSYQQIADTVPGRWIRDIVADYGARIYLSSIDGFYFSDDSCGSWTRPEVPWSEYYYVDEMAVCPDGSILAIAAYDLYRSVDRGESWTLVFDDPSIRFLKTDRTGRAYLVSVPYLYISEDCGLTWAPVLNALHGVNNISIDSGPSGGIFLATGSDGPGLLRSLDDGASWDYLGFTEGWPVDLLAASDGRIYLHMDRNGLFRTYPGDNAWETFHYSYEFHMSRLFGHPDGDMVVSTIDDICRVPLDGPLFTPLGSPKLRDVLSILFAEDGSIYAGTYRNGVHRMQEEGGAWENIGMNGYRVTSLVLDREGRLSASCDFGGVFRYTGEDDIWDQLNQGLGDLYVGAMAALPGGTIIAGTGYSGVYAFDPVDDQWRRLCRYETPVVDIVVRDDTAVIATESSGLYFFREGMTAPASLGDIYDGSTYQLDGRFVSGMSIGPDGYIYLLFENEITRSEYSVDEIDALQEGS